LEGHDTAGAHQQRAEPYREKTQPKRSTTATGRSS
jgi:hypothetical protein